MALDPEALEIISALLDRVEALECKIAERDALLERLRTMHLPTKSECIELRDACAAIGEKPILTQEESYIAVWGPAHFERIWHRDPEPHVQSLQRKWPRWRP